MMDSKNLSHGLEIRCAATGPTSISLKLLIENTLVVAMLKGEDTRTGLVCKFNER